MNRQMLIYCVPISILYIFSQTDPMEFDEGIGGCRVDSYSITKYIQIKRGEMFTVSFLYTVIYLFISKLHVYCLDDFV